MRHPYIESATVLPDRPGTEGKMCILNNFGMTCWNSELRHPKNLLTLLVILIVFIITTFHIVIVPQQHYDMPIPRIITGAPRTSEEVGVVMAQNKKYLEESPIKSVTELPTSQSTEEDEKQHGDRILLEVKSRRTLFDETLTASNLNVTTTPNTAASKTKCRDSLCSEYLTAIDKTRFVSCLQKVREKGGHPQHEQCRFMPQSHRAPVALASYPGSGNTWLRGLLETATGICTGFTFCDISMRMKGFAGENIQSGAVLVVKTHSNPNWKQRKSKSPYFEFAIFLVRNPLDAFVAEWNRRVANNFQGHTISLTSHVKNAGEDMFGTNKRWTEFIRSQIPRWQGMIEGWVINHRKHPILVVKYEDLKKNVTLQVKIILTFLSFPYLDREIEERITSGFNSFQRSHKAKFEHYTPIQRKQILKAISSTSHLLSAHRLTHLLSIDDYLM